MSLPWVAWPGYAGAPATAVSPLQSGVIRLFFPALFAAVGLVLSYIGGSKLLAVWRATRSFESVPARVVSARLDEGPDRTSRTYAPDVTYSYTYDGEEYTSSRVHPGGTWMTGNRARMQEIVDEYEAKVGQEVTAHVDPSDPDNAYLRRGKLWHASVTLGFGVVLLAVGVGLASVVLGG